MQTVSHEENYNLIDWWKKVVIRNYANFRGRARRKEYWYFTLANVLFILPFYGLVIWASLTGKVGLTLGLSGFFSLVSLALFVPSLAVSVRRLHDLNRSGKWLILPYGLLALFYIMAFFMGFYDPNRMVEYDGFPISLVILLIVIFVISIVMLVWFFTPGTVGPNHYGPDPKRPEEMQFDFEANDRDAADTLLN